MIYYIASEPYNEVIRTTITESGHLILGQEVSNEFYLLKFIKLKLPYLTDVEQLVIDLSALRDTDEDILQAIENFRMMYDATKIIILATNRRAGDELLSNLFGLGLYNLVLTDDYVKLRDELSYCITSGKSFRDAVGFKEMEPENEQKIVIQEVKQVINKVMIAVAGSQERIGTTHTCIALAAALRSKGYMVALAEYNLSGDYERIRESFGEEIIENTYYTMSGIDYYPAIDEKALANVLGKSYNFIIVDFGAYLKADQVTYNKANVRLMVCGSRAWELERMQRIFENCPVSMLQEIHYVFPLVYEEHKSDIISSMADQELSFDVTFIDYLPYPYTASDFPKIQEILKNYLPQQETKKKKSFFRRKKGT